MKIAELVPRIRVRGGGDDLQLRMRSQQSQQFAPGVSACPGDSYSISHGNYYAPLRK